MKFDEQGINEITGMDEKAAREFANIVFMIPWIRSPFNDGHEPAAGGH